LKSLAELPDDYIKNDSLDTTPKLRIELFETEFQASKRPKISEY